MKEILEGATDSSSERIHERIEEVSHVVKEILEGVMNICWEPCASASGSRQSLCLCSTSRRKWRRSIERPSDGKKDRGGGASHSSGELATAHCGAACRRGSSGKEKLRGCFIRRTSSNAPRRKTWCKKAKRFHWNAFPSGSWNTFSLVRSWMRPCRVVQDFPQECFYVPHVKEEFVESKAPERPSTDLSL